MMSRSSLLGVAVTSADPALGLWHRPWQPWARAVIWTAITVATALSAHSRTLQLSAGIVMAVAVAGVQLGRLDNPRLARPGVLVAGAGGLATMLLAGAGLGEIPVLVAAARLPFAFSPRGTRILSAVGAIGFGIAVAVASGSIVGLAAGVGVPLLVTRSEQRRELITERDRAQALLTELQATRTAEAQSAALRERARIARDMHDVLAHTLAGLSLQLQAVRAIAGRDGAGAELLDPLDRAAQLARDGLAEARSAVGALREPREHGLGDLRTLVERFPGDITLTTQGGDGQLDPDAGRAAYRAVQEALTNAARYAPGSPVRVRTRTGPSEVSITVEDDGPAPGHSAVAGQGSGLGLGGMRERIGAVGGTVRAGPRPDGGWQIDIRVPRPVPSGPQPVGAEAES
jgi:signal transduction histidine kinase